MSMTPAVWVSSLTSRGRKLTPSWSRASRSLRTWTIAAQNSPSTQGYTPFEGLELSARVDATFLRGMKIYEDGQVLGKPRGQYLHRPTA